MSMAFPSQVSALMRSEVPTRGSSQLRSLTSCLERLGPQQVPHRWIIVASRNAGGILLSFFATGRAAHKSVRGFSPPPPVKNASRRRVTCNSSANASSSTKLYGFLSNDFQSKVEKINCSTLFSNKNWDNNFCNKDRDLKNFVNQSSIL